MNEATYETCTTEYTEVERKYIRCHRLAEASPLTPVAS